MDVREVQWKKNCNALHMHIAIARSQHLFVCSQIYHLPHRIAAYSAQFASSHINLRQQQVRICGAFMHKHTRTLAHSHTRTHNQTLRIECKMQ